MSDRKLDIVCIAFPSWRGDYAKSTVKLMEALALRHRVLYVDYAYTLKDLLTYRRRQPWLPVGRVLGVRSPLERVTAGNGASLHVLSLPPVLPWNWTRSERQFRLVQALNIGPVTRRIRRALRELGMEAPVVVNALNPVWGSAVGGRIGARATLYYCYDNLHASVWASRHGARLEGDCLLRAQAAVFSSEALMEAKSIQGLEGYVVHNGVDVSLLPEPVRPGAHAGTPVVGYAGSLDERLDYALLKRVARLRPEYRFHFVGRVVDARARELALLPNVTLAGPAAPAALGLQMQQFDAGIIPFVSGDFTRYIYPMKVNEYLALGLPVVMTPFARIAALEGLVSTAGDAEVFATALDAALAADTVAQRAARRHFALGNSWSQKALEFEKILYRHVS